jgi:soluble lytic murein transglycosylase-like protein
MVHRLGIFCALIATPLAARAGTLEDYVKSRKSFGITQAAGVVALETFIGERTLEVSGTIKGVIGSEGNRLLILDNSDGPDLYVHATEAPEWMRMGNVQVRMIVTAKRAGENSMIDATLVSAASESEMKSWEIKNAPKPKKPAAAPAPNRGTLSSRGGTRPTTNVLTGAIGQNSKSLSPEIAAVLPAYTKFIMGRNKKLDAGTAQEIAIGILGFSVHYGVDARLIMAMILVESNFNPNATSGAGAQGLGQLMPGTARGLGVSNSYDTEQNLYGTVRLIRGHIDKYSKQTDNDFDALILALAAYNAGSGNVRKHGGVPPFRETQNYVRKVTSTYLELCGTK